MSLVKKMAVAIAMNVLPTDATHAALKAIDDAGYVVVPKMMTEDMHRRTGVGFMNWQELLAAAPKPEVM